MLRIRAEQMEALDRTAQAIFHTRLLKFLRQEMPEQTAEFSDDDLRKRIAESERRAATYGIISNAGVAQFACLTFLDAAFDEVPEVRAYLSEPDGDPEERLDHLAEYLAEADEEDLR